MDKGKLIFIAVALILTLALVFLVIHLKPEKEEQKDVFKKQSEEVTSRVTKKEYENSVQGIMSDYWNSEVLTDAERLDLILQIRESLLDLIVPTDYKDLHLGLVVSLDFIIQDLQGEELKLNQGEEKIGELQKLYPWLK